MNNRLCIVPSFNRPPLTAVRFNQNHIITITQTIDESRRRSAQLLAGYRTEKRYRRIKPLLFVYTHLCCSCYRNPQSLRGKFICRGNHGSGFAAASDKRNGISAADMQFFGKRAFTPVVKTADTVYLIYACRHTRHPRIWTCLSFLPRSKRRAIR